MVESFTAALVECVKACGGSAMVGARLWPEKTPDAAQRTLLDCLNDERPARLAPDQVMFVMRLARDRGCHVGMTYLCEHLGYAPPQPVAPRDELAEHLRKHNEIMRQLTESMRESAGYVERLQAVISQPSNLRAV